MPLAVSVSHVYALLQRTELILGQACSDSLTSVSRMQVCTKWNFVRIYLRLPHIAVALFGTVLGGAAGMDCETLLQLDHSSDSLYSTLRTFSEIQAEMNDPPSGKLYADWPATRRHEIQQNWNNRKVGTRVVSETESLRVWHLVLLPGERAPFHRHDEPYFWTVMGNGKARSYYHDGSVSDVEYVEGDTMHFDLRDGNFFVHDLENIGNTKLSFVTVEFKT